MKYFLGLHARERCIERGFDPDVVCRIVNKYGPVIARVKADNVEVKVILKVFSQTVITGDGSGDCIVAAVDPTRGCIKTVSWRRWSQLNNDRFPVVGGRNG